MRFAKTITAVVTVCLMFACCNRAGSEQTAYFGFQASVFPVIDEKDTHGGFHGDGFYYLLLDCSEKTEEAKALIKDWKPLPLTENLQLIMYGGEKNGVSYGYYLAEKAHWPVINNGVYKFLDRYPDAVDEAEDRDLFNRNSYNFSVAVYDLDTNILYYFEFDT